MNRFINLKFLNILLIVLLIVVLNYLKNVGHTNKEILKNLLNKNWEPKYSIYMPEVIETQKILQKNNIENFTFTKNFLNKDKLYAVNNSNKYIYYRTITYSYPILFDANSKNIILHQNEKMPNNCGIIEQGKFISLIKC
tara:strand:- start:598 stop:1014 length:417 start_codon:yes stop_codon:yes gene_type:complete